MKSILLTIIAGILGATSKTRLLENKTPCSLLQGIRAEFFLFETPAVSQTLPSDKVTPVASYGELLAKW
jgi:hypothetical protein